MGLSGVKITSLVCSFSIIFATTTFASDNIVGSEEFFKRDIDHADHDHTTDISEDDHDHSDTESDYADSSSF